MEKIEYQLKKDEQYSALSIDKKMTRVAFAETLVELAKEDKRIVGLAADLMYPTSMDKFAKEFPDRFFNVGVAEQNMIGIAAGLATCGKIPFAATFAVFATTRACEQVRTDIAYPKLNVKIVGIAAGLSFGMAGVTHQSTEDIAIMRSLANMTVFVPCDAIETKNVVKAAIDIDGPVYIRLGRTAEPIINQEGYQFTAGKAVTLKEGDDITIIATGSMVFESILASDELKKEGIKARVINFHTIKPFDEKIVIKSIHETKAIIAIEEHNVIGGLGEAVARVVAETPKVPLRCIGLPDVFSIAGKPDDLREIYGLNSKNIVKVAKQLLNLV